MGLRRDGRRRARRPPPSPESWPSDAPRPPVHASQARPCPDPDRPLPIFILLPAAAPGMEYVYAALLLHKLDKDVTEESVSSVVQASGAEVNQAQVKSLVAALADVDIDEAVKATPVAVAAAAAPAAAPAAEESGDAAEEKKEKDDSQSEEQAMAGLTSLFG